MPFIVNHYMSNVFPLTGGESTIHYQSMSSNPNRFVGNQKKNGPGHIFWCSQPSQRMHRRESCGAVRILAEAPTTEEF